MSDDLSTISTENLTAAVTSLLQRPLTDTAHTLQSSRQIQIQEFRRMATFNNKLQDLQLEPKAKCKENISENLSSANPDIEEARETMVDGPQASRLISYRECKKKKQRDLISRFGKEVDSDKIQPGKEEEKRCKEETNDEESMKSKRTQKNKKQNSCSISEKQHSHDNPAKHFHSQNDKSNNFCAICDESFVIKNSFLSHMRVHNGIKNENKDYKCHLCGKKYSSRGNLNSHINRVHKRKHECPICFKPFCRPCKVKAHMLTHSNIKPFICSFCGKSLKTEKGLKRHESEHMAIKGSWKCELCDLRFVSSFKMNQHVRRRHRVKVYQCSVCQLSFSCKLKLADHQSVHSKERPFLCDICNKTYKILRHIKSHIDDHFSERITCKICGVSIKNKSNYSAHLRKHDKLNIHVCEICGKGLSSAYILRNHLNTHIEPHLRVTRKFECNVCNKEFRNENSLYIHKRIHKKDIRFVCDVCGKRFTQSYSLTVHKRVHTGAKPFKCEICGIAYTQSYPLTLHKRKKHQ